jgi:poly(3-hydroxybutyrate) depolymerase
MRAALTAALLFAALLPPSAAQGQAADPIDDLQWLAIENIVAPVIQPVSEHLPEAAALNAQARERLLRGELGEARRLYSQARALVHGGQWNRDSEFVASLALRPSRVAVDPGEPLELSIGQHFAAGLPRESADIRLRILARRWPAAPSSDGIDELPLAEALLAGPDLVEQPQHLLLDVAGLIDGSWELVAEVLRNGDLLGRSATRIFVAQGLDHDRRRLREGLANLAARPGVAASIEYPLDLGATLDQRTRKVRDVDLRAELDAALALLDAAAAGQDPLWQARGNFARHYASRISGRIEPYRVFVPEQWDGASTLPLVVVLHGSGGDERSVFASGELERVARDKGVAILSPMGDDPNSVWGNRLPVVLADGSVPPPRPVVSAGRVQPVERLAVEPAEEDVAATLALVRAEFPIDPQRIYLAGNSMGGEGTWHLATKWPDLWAAIAPGAGPIEPGLLDYRVLSKLPVLIVHGRHDPITSFEASRRTLDRLNAAGGAAEILAPDDAHDAFGHNLTAIIDFLLAHSRPKQGRP